MVVFNPFFSRSITVIDEMRWNEISDKQQDLQMIGVKLN